MKHHKLLTMKYLINFICLLLIASSVSAQEIPLFTSEFIVQDSVLIKTRDGATISATIVRKVGNNKPLPAILFFTTYYLGAGDVNVPKRAADRDYVGIIAYSRGIRTGLSNYVPFEHEADDVYDVIDWISKQPWSNGKVGMYGGSYTGFAQWAATKKIHPALKTIVPQVAIMPGNDFPMENNIPIASILNWSHDNIYNYKRLPQNFYQLWYEKGATYRSLDTLAEQPNVIFQKWLSHPAYDDYWKSLIPSKEQIEKINIPILVTTGYYDGAQISALEYVKQYLRYNKKPQLYVVIGPYDHRGGQRTAPSTLMGYHIDTVANVDMRELSLQWLDYILKGNKKPDILKGRINYEVMGADEWKHVPSFGSMNNDTLTFYLSSMPDQKNYDLTTDQPKTQSYATQHVDFKDRSEKGHNNYFTPFIINDSLNTSNGLTFFTKPFEKPFSINGSFTGDLKLMINKKDVDISIAVYEQTPDGKFFYLTRYLGRASFAKDPGRRQLLQPGKIENIPFTNTRLVSKQINKGSRLVIILNVNKHPYEEINYGTGKDVNAENISDANEPLQIKWYNSSFIKVPVWSTKNTYK